MDGATVLERASHWERASKRRRIPHHIARVWFVIDTKEGDTQASGAETTLRREGGRSGRRPSPWSGPCRRRPGSGAGWPATTPSASARSPTSLRGTCATISRCSTRAMASEPLERLNAALAGRYALAHELGSGGMATVYLADDLKHHRPVAVKVLRPDLASVLGPERFLREVEIAARLNHPHIP